MSVESAKSQSGIAQHPKYYGAKINSSMQLPGDTRLFRDIKLYEVPSWLMKRNWSPLGMWFSFKRFRHGVFTKYIHVRGRKGVLLAQMVAAISLAMYVEEYKYTKREMHRKYH